MGWMAHRKWKEARQLPGTAGPGNMLGCCLVSFHFRCDIHIRPVHNFCRQRGRHIWKPQGRRTAAAARRPTRSGIIPVIYGHFPRNSLFFPSFSSRRRPLWVLGLSRLIYRLPFRARVPISASSFFPQNIPIFCQISNCIFEAREQ